MRRHTQPEYSPPAVLATALAMVCAGGTSAAQTFPPIAPPGGGSPTPRAPSLTAPRHTVQASVGSTLALQWTQFLHAPFRAPQPNYFIICVFEPATSSCSTAPLDWTLATSAIPRIPLMSAGHLIGHSYTFELPDPLSAKQLDRPLQWSVGACTTTLAASCTFAAPMNLWLSTKDLAATNVSDGMSGATYLYAEGEVSNLGASASGPFRAVLSIWPAIYDTTTASCLTDVDSSLAMNGYAHTKAGELLDISQLPLGPDNKLDVSGHRIVGITAEIGPLVTEAVTVRLNAGDVAYVVQADTAAVAPAAFVTLLFADATDAVTEYDETDNRLRECHVIR